MTPVSSPSQVTDPRAKRFGSIAKWLFLIFGFAFLAPVVWLALGGLVGFLAFAGVWTVSWMLRPWIFMKAANLRLKFIREEAMRNPVETLLVTFKDRGVELDRRRKAIEEFYGSILAMEKKVEDIADRFGDKDRDYIRLSGDLVKLKKVYAFRCQKWQEARDLLNQFKEEIDRAGMIWEAGCAAAKARESSGYTEADFLQQLKTDTAFDAIDKNYANALASLDTAMLDGPTQPIAVESGSKAIAIDMPADEKQRLPAN